jgi:putative transferase (TIGR04331 family)
MSGASNAEAENGTAGRLILGAADSEFDPARDIALGPWCFVGAENLFPRWEQLAFPDPFATPDAWVEADRACRRLANQLIPEWAARMNARHGRSYSVKFWRVLLLNWLTTAVPALWSRYRFVEETIRAHGRRPLTVALLPDRPEWPVPASIDLMPLLWSRKGDWLMSSYLVRALAPAAWTLQEIAGGDDDDTARPPDFARPTAMGNLVRRVLGRLPFGHVPGVRALRLPLSAAVALMPRRPPRVHYHFTEDAAGQFPARFLEVLNGFLERTLPRTLSSGFAALETHALAQRYHPGRLLVDVLNSEDDATRIVTAMAHERGEKLVSAQHGGTYGTHRGMMAAAETEYRYHAFLTWGWDRQDDCEGQFVPLPSPMLSKLANRHRETEASLVLVGGSMVVHGTRLGWLPKPQHYLSYRRAKLEFIAGLGAGPRQALAYRPYRRNVTVLEDEEFVHRAHPGLPLVTGDLNAAMLGCRLLVLDHPITTMLTAMAANIPTVLYWERDAWPLAQSAEPYFQHLRDAGILFHDPAEAAAKVNAVWDDVPGWWNGTEIQAARTAFARQFARTSRLWPLHWLAALWRLARQNG